MGLVKAIRKANQLLNEINSGYPSPGPQYGNQAPVPSYSAPSGVPMPGPVPGPVPAEAPAPAPAPTTGPPTLPPRRYQSAPNPLETASQSTDRSFRPSEPILSDDEARLKISKVSRAIWDPICAKLNIAAPLHRLEQDSQGRGLEIMVFDDPTSAIHAYLLVTGTPEAARYLGSKQQKELIEHSVVQSWKDLVPVTCELMLATPAKEVTTFPSYSVMMRKLYESAVAYEKMQQSQDKAQNNYQGVAANPAANTSTPLYQQPADSGIDPATQQFIAQCEAQTAYYNQQIQAMIAQSNAQTQQIWKDILTPTPNPYMGGGSGISSLLSMFQNNGQSNEAAAAAAYQPYLDQAAYATAASAYTPYLEQTATPIVSEGVNTLTQAVGGIFSMITGIPIGV